MLHLILAVVIIYAMVRIVIPFTRRPQTRDGARQLRQGIGTIGNSAAEMYRERRAETRAKQDSYSRYRDDIRFKKYQI